VRDRTELGPHEPYPTLAAKVGGRRGQGSLGREGEHAGPVKSWPGDSQSDGGRAARAHNSAGITHTNPLRVHARKSPRRPAERPRKGVRMGLRKLGVARGRSQACAGRAAKEAWTAWFAGGKEGAKGIVKAKQLNPGRKLRD
jgi:hypothetical protein